MTNTFKNAQHNYDNMLPQDDDDKISTAICRGCEMEFETGGCFIDDVCDNCLDSKMNLSFVGFENKSNSLGQVITEPCNFATDKVLGYGFNETPANAFVARLIAKSEDGFIVKDIHGDVYEYNYFKILEVR